MVLATRHENVDSANTTRGDHLQKQPHVGADPLDHALGIEQLFLEARDALVVLELNSGHIARWNPAAEALFGYSAAEVVGRSIDVLLPPAVARLRREQLTQYRRSQQAELLVSHPALGVLVLNRAGREVRAELSMVPLEVPGRPAAWVLMTFRDVRCKQELEVATAAVARSDLERVDVEIRLSRCEELLTSSTRDLAMPLDRARRSAARLTRLAACANGQRPERIALLARVVEARTRDVQRSLDEIAETTAIHAGAFELNVTAVNLVPLVAQLVTDARSRSGLHRVNLGAPQGLTATCDAERIGTVIDDLITRAFRRNPRGCWIDVDLRRPLAGLARVEVRDYGRALTQRERERVQRAPLADRRWYISQRVIAAHRGTLEVDFPEEGGMRVTLSLPTRRGQKVRM